MKIFINSGQGHGETMISAFDTALFDAGIHNYNLIKLSSIVPPQSEIQVNVKRKVDHDEYGRRLYVVMAEKRSRESGKYIGAALGWYQIEDGRGVFVEHEEIGETKQSVRANLTEEVRKSLANLCQLRKFPFSAEKTKMELSITKVTDSPACALVTAIYQSEPWE